MTSRIRSWFYIDLRPPHRAPSGWRVLLATALSIGVSLLADALLVALGTRVFPSTVGYVHFQFHDYATLTIVGIVIACVAWPVVARICAEPRWLFFWSAIAVTAVLLLPDLWLLAKGQPAKAVIVLVAMHLAIGVITYNFLVRLAPVRSSRRSDQRGAMVST
jgi:hypothetical protein